MGRPRPLRTRRAPFRRTGLKQALKAFRSGCRKCWFTVGAVWAAASAVSVDETECDAFVRCPGPRVEGDRVVTDRLTGRCDPQFPVVGVLRLGLGVEQQLAAERAASVLFEDKP